jgi:hypothetical protein
MGSPSTSAKAGDPYAEGFITTEADMEANLGEELRRISGGPPVSNDPVSR